MAQELIQTQEERLEQQQVQRLTAQQVMVVRMIEMPLTQFEQNVQSEMDVNPALESDGGSDDEAYGSDDSFDSPQDSGDTTDDFNEQTAREERRDELDSALDSLDSDDRLPTSNYERANNHDPDADQEERVYGNAESFYDYLHNQVREQSLTEQQEIIMDYLIGSLDSDGLLRKDLSSLCDEIAISEYIDINEDDVERVLNVLQSFDPAGIGAQSLQQCLLIQVLRRKPSPVTKLMHTVIDSYWNDFSRKHWTVVQQRMHMSDATAKEVFAEICRLNPRPGAALGETMGRNTQQVTPDFTVDVDPNANEGQGAVSFTLNKGRLPELHVSRDFEEMISGYRQNPASMTRSDKEALLYAQQKVNSARMFIDAIQQRQRTMCATMQTIVHLQKKYFLTGDESDLIPLTLRDVAERTGFDISTISRVCRAKYAETPWGIKPLRDFFADGYSTGDGEEVSTKKIKAALRDLISEEDKRHPLSDIKLAAELKKQGFPIARRTVAKYREQMGIPTSVLRK